jgi:putative transposase
MNSWQLSRSSRPLAGLEFGLRGRSAAKLTKMVLESALEREMSDHLGYPAGDPVGRNGGITAP